MESKNLSKKQLTELISQTVEEAIAKLELPKATKRVKKLLSRSSKKLALEFSEVMKKAEKKAKKAKKEVAQLEEVLSGKGKKKGKIKARKADKKARKATKQKEVQGAELEMAALA